jgi:hypothetical protein
MPTDVPVTLTSLQWKNLVVIVADVFRIQITSSPCHWSRCYVVVVVVVGGGGPTVPLTHTFFSYSYDSVNRRIPKHKGDEQSYPKLLFHGSWVEDSIVTCGGGKSDRKGSSDGANESMT